MKIRNWTLIFKINYFLKWNNLYDKLQLKSTNIKLTQSLLTFSYIVERTIFGFTYGAKLLRRNSKAIYRMRHVRHRDNQYASVLLHREYCTWVLWFHKIASISLYNYTFIITYARVCITQLHSISSFVTSILIAY